MKKIFFLLVLACSSFSALQAQFSYETINVGAATRQYRQYLPSGFSASAEPGLPLVIALHGLGDNYTNFSNVGFQFLADTARFLVVYPNGTLNGFGQNAWNNGTILGSAADDNGFISRIIDTMSIKYNIDLAKVYVTGMSMGGIMTYHALCGLPERIAAIASVAGTMSTADLSACNPGRPVPVMHLHGTADGTVPYAGGLPSLSGVQQTIAFWQNNNTCTDSSIISLPDLVPGDSITIDVLDYNACSAPVQLWRENNADHEWLYYPVNDITATIEIWLFFRGKTHPAPSMLSVDHTADPANISLAPNASGLTVFSGQNIHEVMVTDLQGRNMFAAKGNLGNEYLVNLSSSSSQPCIVTVRTGNGWATKKFMLVK